MGNTLIFNDIKVTDFQLNLIKEFHSSHKGIQTIALQLLSDLLEQNKSLKVLDLKWLFGPIFHKKSSYTTDGIYTFHVRPLQIRNHYRPLIRMLEKNNIIKKLHLGGQGIPLEGLIAIIEAAVKHPSLTLLSLRGNQPDEEIQKIPLKS